MHAIALYARTVLPLVPGASLLPFVPGRGDEMPALERSRSGVRVDPDRLAAYRRVCGLATGDALPACYPHVLASALHLELMADGRFPFPAVGLVHVANHITTHRPVDAAEPLDLHAETTPLEEHHRGRTFSLVTRAHAGEELVWEERSTILRRGGGSGERASDSRKPPRATEEWEVAGDVGRRYAAVSGDPNPIHLHALTARAFGFPRAIAHGMWTKARCLAALEDRLPHAFTVDVSFRRPVLLPGTVRFGSRTAGGVTSFAVRGDGDVVHLEGTVSA